MFISLTLRTLDLEILRHGVHISHLEHGFLTLKVTHLSNGVLKGNSSSKTKRNGISTPTENPRSISVGQSYGYDKLYKYLCYMFCS